MLDRLRGRPKVDPALEEVRRKTAARLAAIVGLTSEDELDTELDPSQPPATTLAEEPEAHDDLRLETPMLALAASTDHPIGEEDEAAPAGTEAGLEVGPGPMGEAATPGHASEREPVDDDAPLALAAREQAVPAADPSDGASDATVEPEPAVVPVPLAGSLSVTLPANAVGVMATTDGDATEAVAATVAPSVVLVRAHKAAVVRAATAPAEPGSVPRMPVRVTRPTKAARPPVMARPGAQSARTAKTGATAKPPALGVEAPPLVTRRAKPEAAAKVASPKRDAGAAARPTRGRGRRAVTDLPAACPTCGRLLDEVPATARRCLGCRQRIVPKRLDGRTVLLAEAVLPLFEAERRRLVDGGRLARECGQWLRLAALVGAPADVLEARARAVAARPTREAVASAQKLYAATVDRACRAARQSKDWRTVADLRFRQARAYHRASGAPIPPEPAVVALHQEAIDATLRAIAGTSREAQLAAAVCCEACSSKSGQVVRISVERKEPSLPHADCPVGLCGCRWELRERRRPAVGDLARRRGQPAASPTRKAKATAG